MIPGALARRYARALLGLASTPMQRDKFAKDLTSFCEVLEQRDSDGTAVLTVLTGKRFPLSQRRKLVEALCARIGVDPTLVKFLVYVLERDRFVGVPQIERAYARLADEAAGRLRATITSAKPLPMDAAAKLKTALEASTGKEVVAETTVDPELIGGIVTQVGSYLLDGSVRSALQNIRATLGHK